MNDTLTSKRTKLEMLQALARRHSERLRLVPKTHGEPSIPPRLKASPKVILAPV